MHHLKKILKLSFLFIHLSRRDDDSWSLQEVISKIDQLKQVAGSLPDITLKINQLSELAKTKSTDASLHPIKEAFTCLVCKGTCKICYSK